MVDSVSGSTSSSTSSASSNFGSSIVNSVTGGTIDIQKLADDLTNASKAPRQALIDQRKQVADARISSIGKITSAANDFQTQITGLGDARALGYRPQSTNSSAADFSFQSFTSPKPINLTFVVKKLATQNMITLPTINSAGPLIGTDGADAGTLTIKKNDGTIIDSINFSGEQTLASLASSINSNAKTNGTGLYATILNVVPNADGSYEQSLTITNGMGEDNQFSVELNFSQSGVSFSDNSTGLQLNTSATLNQSSGTDAEIAMGPYTDVDGNTAYQTTVTSSTNTFSKLISGVNIKVHAVTSDNNPVTLTTEKNVEGLLGALQTIVDGYNSILKVSEEESKYNSTNSTRGGLATDSIAKTFISQLRSLSTTSFPDGNGNTYTLADLGVKTNTSDGTLSINTDLISKVAQEKQEILVAVLTTKTATTSDGSPWPGPTGAIAMMEKLNKIVTGTNSDFSKLLKRTSDVDEQKISDDQDRLDKEMTKLKDRYLRQFTAMQNILNSTKSDQNSLTNMMSSWTAGLKG